MAEIAVGKRIKISKIQQHMMLAVLGASLVFGVSLVLSIYFVKYIIFNTTVINEKDVAIENYYKAISNVGICIDSNGDKKFTDRELEKCVPNDIDVNDIQGTLRYNVLVGMTENEDLESVAREGISSTCYDPATGKKFNFTELYQNAETEEARQQYLYDIKLCSSLRVIPDALPASQNQEALLSSMNQIFLLSGLQPEALSPSNTGAVSPVNGLEVIPISVSIKENILKSTRLLENLERSIRSFYFTNATITWRGGMEGQTNLELAAQALAFYTNQVEATETQKTIYASADAKKASGTTAAGQTAVEKAESKVTGK